MSVTIALAGNPNSGKTTLFNALTGANQFVGNWPGVTVEKKEGKLKSDKSVTVVDLPGVYSLSPYSLEEVIARNYLLGERPDAIINIIDGTNLERNLYLTTQLTEMGIPTVVAINMMDILLKNGDKIDIQKLSKSIGCPVVEISALKGTGIQSAADKAVQAATAKNIPTPPHTFGGDVEHAIAHIEEALLHSYSERQQRFFAIKLFERDEKVAEFLKLTSSDLSHIARDIEACEAALDDTSESIIINERYTYIASIIGKCYVKKNRGRMSTTDKIDRIVTNRWLALPIFAVVIALIYVVSVSTLGAIVTDWANDGLFGDGFYLFGTWIPGVPVLLGNLLERLNTSDWLSGLILDGIVTGVGAVLGFVPQMLLLFFFLAFLEACGYMARIAFILDRIFRKFGLSGKSFIPMLIGTGCGVPGIMASRTIENERDRRMTIMTTTFIPCSAKLPIIALISGALFGGAWWVAPSAYFLGMAAIIVSGILLKKTRLFAGDPAPFVMELPAYHWPTIGTLLRGMWERGWSFIKKAGTIILLSTVFVWFASRFGFVDGTFGMVDDLENGLLARLGKLLAPVFRPLGFGQWQAAVATVTGVLAKENVVGTLGVLYGYAEVSEIGWEFWAALAKDFTMVSAYAFLAFNLLCAPCVAAIGAIRREMNSAKWTWIAIAYQTGFAYVIALMIYQLGRLFTGGGPGVGTAVAVACLAMMGYLLFRKEKGEKRDLDDGVSCR